jgi:hypothetical protein
MFSVCSTSYLENSSAPLLPVKRGQTIFIGKFREHWVTYLLKGLAVFTAAIAFSGCGGIKAPSTAASTGSFTASSTNVQFGTATVGTPVNSDISLVNLSSTSVVISQVSASGASFSINSLAALPLTVSAGGTATFKIQFDASSTGAVTGQVAVASNSPSNPAITIQLSGTGAAAGTPPAGVAGLTVNSSTVAFGGIGVGVPSIQSLTLTSSGMGPVIVTADSLTGAGFTASGITLPLTIAAEHESTPSNTATVVVP